jgi:hypothetical protein
MEIETLEGKGYLRVNKIADSATSFLLILKGTGYVLLSTELIISISNEVLVNCYAISAIDS